MTASAVAVNPSDSLLAGVNTRKDGANAKLDEAEDRFLKLLTTQLQNQDPLNPLDNAQMTSQLAQISTVDGIEKLNTTLKTMLSNTTDTQTMQAATLVNHGVLVPGSRITLQEEGAIAGLELATAADDAVVTIKDANGLTVRTLNLGALKAGVHPFSWDGNSDSGAQAVPGNYSFSVSARRGTASSSATALAFGMVQAVTRGSSGMSLDIGTLGAFTLADVRQIL